MTVFCGFLQIIYRNCTRRIRNTSKLYPNSQGPNLQRAVTSLLPKSQWREQRIDLVVTRNDTPQVENTIVGPSAVECFFRMTDRSSGLGLILVLDRSQRVERGQKGGRRVQSGGTQ